MQCSLSAQRCAVEPPPAADTVYIRSARCAAGYGVAEE